MKTTRKLEIRQFPGQNEQNGPPLLDSAVVVATLKTAKIFENFSKRHNSFRDSIRNNQ